MDVKQVAKDTTKVVSSYLTYQAMRIVLAQLSENNPPLALWLHAFSGQNTIQDGELYLQKLAAENQELALRMMTVREHLVEEIVDEIPEMVRHTIAVNNTQRRREQLEKLTQISIVEPPEESTDSSAETSS
jgi:GTPase Era involved in 16S rRNA processing